MAGPQVYDLTTSFNTEDVKGGTSSIRGEEAPGTVAYTWITVKSTAKNFAVAPESKSITNAPFTNAPATGFNEAGSAFSATSRLTSSIALPLPKNLPYAWQNDWSESETGITEQLVSQVASGSTFSDVASSAASGIKNQILQAVNSSYLQKMLQKNAGVAPNPFKEMYYNGVAFRQFQFSWDFAPQNQQEAETLERLIFDLELASHPELTDHNAETNTTSFLIPDVFDIVFVGTRTPRIQTAALTNMTVEYAQNGPKFFADGHAAFVDLTLSFTELIPLTRREIQESARINRGGR